MLELIRRREVWVERESLPPNPSLARSHPMETKMRKPRTPETHEHRQEREDRAANVKILEAKAADKAVDARIRTSIDLYGA